LICGKNAGWVQGVHGGFGYGKQNVKGEGVLDFADSIGIKVANTW